MWLEPTAMVFLPWLSGSFWGGFPGVELILCILSERSATELHLLLCFIEIWDLSFFFFF